MPVPNCCRRFIDDPCGSASTRNNDSHTKTEQYVKWFAEASGLPGADDAVKSLVTVEEMLQKQQFDFLGEAAIVGTRRMPAR